MRRESPCLRAFGAASIPGSRAGIISREGSNVATSIILHSRRRTAAGPLPDNAANTLPPMPAHRFWRTAEWCVCRLGPICDTQSATASIRSLGRGGQGCAGSRSASRDFRCKRRRHRESGRTANPRIAPWRSAQAQEYLDRANNAGGLEHLCDSPSDRRIKLMFLVVRFVDRLHESD